MTKGLKQASDFLMFYKLNHYIEFGNLFYIIVVIGGNYRYKLNFLNAFSTSIGGFITGLKCC